MNLFGAKILVLSKKHLRDSLKGEEDALAERKGEAEEPCTCIDEARKETKKTLTILFYTIWRETRVSPYYFSKYKFD